MTSLVKQVFEELSTCKDANDNIRIHQCRTVLRSKQKKVRPKCNQVLKRKLKKYKLRQDGKEDQDILDASYIFESSLTIRTPNEEKTSAELELERLRPKNYLFKMGRRKQAVIVTQKYVKPNTNVEMGNENVLVVSSTEEKKHTDAFKLLMDSRNKSLGSNSPGKEKSIDETELRGEIEKKTIKAKRQLVLQKMAESKGSLKKKEMENITDKYINKKMEKRAQRFKSMITKSGPIATKVTNEKSGSKLNGHSPLSLKTEKNENKKEKPVKVLQLANMFPDVEQKIMTKSPDRKLITKEDKEFLNKLSPSLKKKESMLSYFNKIKNETDCSIIDNENDNVIKVKLGTKKKGKKKKLSLNKGGSKPPLSPKPEKLINETEVINPDIIAIKEIVEPLTMEESNESRKRKRKMKANTDDGAVSSSNIIDSRDCGRSRRCLKQTVKYGDGSGYLSSDEELHIFTPKKKKQADTKNNLKTVSDNLVNISSGNEEKLKSKKPNKNEKNKSKNNIKESVKGENENKTLKFAPIFSSKSQPNPMTPIALEAKQKFLQSGVPDKLKKMMARQVEKCVASDSFLKVVHIQQLNGVSQSTSVQLSPQELDVFVDNEHDSQNSESISFTKLLNMGKSQDSFLLNNARHSSPQLILQNLKEKYPRYPVNRTYRLLRAKKKGDFKTGANYLDLDNSVEILNASLYHLNENPEQLSWSDKYKPLAASQIIGNFDSVKELRKWLVSWAENDIKSKSNGNESDSSDYYQSDGDSKDSVKSSNNLLVLSGPVGSGKTSCVYAIAAELSIKVIEVNASSKRTGKIMLQDLQEATQSHKVNRGTSSNENSQKSDTIEPQVTITNPVKTRGRPKKKADNSTKQKSVLKKSISKEKSDIANGAPASQENKRTCMSLILIDDADIVFDQDDGFCSAIVQLVQCSKRPVILITSSLSCPHLQRFTQSSMLVKMSPLLPNILGTWLDIMCLADSGIYWPGVGSKLLNFFKGDIRKTINCLQFYVCSQEQDINQDDSCSQNNDCIKPIDDENSNMSWADRDVDEKNEEPSDQNNLSKNFIPEQIYFMQYKCPDELFNIWWSVPTLLTSQSTEQMMKTGTKKSLESMESISKVLDSISLCDSYSPSYLQTHGNLTSHPWFLQESHSVSELENFDKYDRYLSTSNDIAHELASLAINNAQATLGCERKINMTFPGMVHQRQRDRIVSRHNNLTSFLSPQAILDRKALALDYWSSCRTICRVERSKTDTNSKRNNRFCHYLKSLSVLCKNGSFDKLANSLSPSEKLSAVS